MPLVCQMDLFLSYREISPDCNSRTNELLLRILCIRQQKGERRKFCEPDSNQMIQEELLWTHFTTTVLHVFCTSQPSDGLLKGKYESKLRVLHTLWRLLLVMILKEPTDAFAEILTTPTNYGEDQTRHCCLCS